MSSRIRITSKRYGNLTLRKRFFDLLLIDFDLDHRYFAENTWSGEIRIKMEAVIANGWDPEEYEPVEADCGEPEALVLWPVN